MRMFGNVLPKTFGSKNVLDMSVASVRAAFNDGASGALEIMKKVGLSAGYYNMEASRNADLVRISGVAYKATECNGLKERSFMLKRRDIAIMLKRRDIAM